MNKEGSEFFSTTGADMNSSPVVADSRLTSRWLSWAVGIGVLAAAGFGVWLFAFGGRSMLGLSSNEQQEDARKKASKPTKVETIRPKVGGITRYCVQPGTVEPFESADLYAKVSGFLLYTVDINAKVRQGQVLALISVPEYEKQVLKDEALVVNATAKVKQMEAQLTASRSEEKASREMIELAKITKKSKSAYRSYRFKQLERIKGLYADNAVDAKLVDEAMDNYEAAFETENAATEAITTSGLKWDAAKARVAQADADLEEAKAAVDVATAELEKAKVLLDYTFIKSPYTGVVTKRNFNRGDFIRSADAGGDRMPIVAVDRTDLMRVVIQVPDSDVPYVDIGDKATVQIASLPDLNFKGKVARSAHAEDAQTRTMRTEVDVPNNDKKLVRNMYGRVTILLAEGAAGALRIPSTALVSKEGRKGQIRIVENGRVHIATVEVGTDNGAEVEIVKGLKESDHVIVRTGSSVEEGTAVEESNTVK
jgi:HlyD family secretion protein